MRNKKEITKKPIEVGMIVVYAGGGWCKVTKVTKKTVNLGSVFGKTIYYKGVDINLVTEDSDAFYDNWRKSEAYQCM